MPGEENMNMPTPIMAGERSRKLKYSIVDGATVITSALDAAKSFTANPSTYPAEIQAKLLSFGHKNLLSDRVAHISDIDEKLAEMATIHASLLAGTWSESRTGDGGPDGLSQTHQDFVRAAALLTKKPEEELTGALLAMDPEARKSYVKAKSAHKAIQAHMATFAADRAKERAKELAKAAKGEGSDLFTFD
jgi:nicotinamide mononucleotide (NMN) deamidase PncC